MRRQVFNNWAFNQVSYQGLCTKREFHIYTYVAYYKEVFFQTVIVLFVLCISDEIQQFLVHSIITETDSLFTKLHKQLEGIGYYKLQLTDMIMSEVFFLFHDLLLMELGNKVAYGKLKKWNAYFFIDLITLSATIFVIKNPIILINKIYKTNYMTGFVGLWNPTLLDPYLPRHQTDFSKKKPPNIGQIYGLLEPNY